MSKVSLELRKKLARYLALHSIALDEITDEEIDEMYALSQDKEVQSHLRGRKK